MEPSRGSLDHRQAQAQQVRSQSDRASVFLAALDQRRPWPRRKLRRQQFMSDHLRGARRPSPVCARRPARSRTLQRNKAVSEIAPDIIQPRHSPIKQLTRSNSIGYRQVRQLISPSFFWSVARTTRVFLATVHLIRVESGTSLPSRRCGKASLSDFQPKIDTVRI